MIFTAILLLIFLAFGLRTGVSYVVHYRTDTTIYLWQQSLDNRPSLHEWQDRLDLLETILAFDDENPDLLNVRGRLYFYRAKNMAESVKKSLRDYKQAMVDYRAVIALRPAWPYGYLNLLYSKMLANEVDAEMRHSLLSLIKLGPWEKATLVDTVKAAVFAWPSLDVKSKRIVKSYLLSVSDKRKGELRLALSDSHYRAYFCQKIVKGETVALCQ